MELQNDPEFVSFAGHRRRLNSLLDQTREELDHWMDANLVRSVNVAELARLSGLLQKRRDALAELAQLDDSLLTYLIKLMPPNVQQ